MVREVWAGDSPKVFTLTARYRGGGRLWEREGDTQGTRKAVTAGGPAAYRPTGRLLLGPRIRRMRGVFLNEELMVASFSDIETFISDAPH